MEQYPYLSFSASQEVAAQNSLKTLSFSSSNIFLTDKNAIQYNIKDAKSTFSSNAFSRYTLYDCRDDYLYIAEVWKPVEESFAYIEFNSIGIDKTEYAFENINGDLYILYQGSLVKICDEYDVGVFSCGANAIMSKNKAYLDFHYNYGEYIIYNINTNFSTFISIPES